MASEHVKEFTDVNWDVEVLSSKEPVLVDFWAPWCGPCISISPVLESVAEKYTGRVKVGKVNVDENRNIPAQFQIRSIPTFILFKNGEIADQAIGAIGQEKIEEMLDKVI